jgi:hypothetical protein
VLGKDRAGDHGVLEVGAILSVGDHGLAVEGEAHASRLSGNRRIDRAGEAHHQLGRVALVQLQAVANRNVADEQAPRRRVQLDRLRQQLVHDLWNRTQWNVAAVVLQNEIRRQLVVLSQELRLVLALIELCFDCAATWRSELHLIFLAIGTGIDFAEWLKQVNQPGIRQTLHIQQRNGIRGLRRIDRELVGRLSMHRREMRDRGGQPSAGRTTASQKRERLSASGNLEVIRSIRERCTGFPQRYMQCRAVERGFDIAARIPRKTNSRSLAGASS